MLAAVPVDHLLGCDTMVWYKVLHCRKNASIEVDGFAQAFERKLGIFVASHGAPTMRSYPFCSSVCNHYYLLLTRSHLQASANCRQCFGKSEVLATKE